MSPRFTFKQANAPTGGWSSARDRGRQASHKSRGIAVTAQKRCEFAVRHSSVPDRVAAFVGITSGPVGITDEALARWAPSSIDATDRWCDAFNACVVLNDHMDWLYVDGAKDYRGFREKLCEDHVMRWCVQGEDVLAIRADVYFPPGDELAHGWVFVGWWQ